MSCKRSEQCDHADICQFAQSDDYHLLGGSCYRPKKPMTNEEWFISLPTEEKAKWLSRNSKFMYGCGRMETTPKIMYEEDWECWLKEKHNDN